jgi:hypothetical protein
MSIKKCPICGNKTLKIKYDEPDVTYYSHKTKCKKIKIFECDSCKYQQEIRKDSFSKAFFKEFKKLRNESTKKTINDIIWLQSEISHMSKTATKIDLGRVLYLDRNYFQDILDNKRKVTSADAALVEILFNFPFIFKCAAHNFETKKTIEYLRDFISQFDNIDLDKQTTNDRYPHDINKISEIKHDCTKMPSKSEIEKVMK